MYLAIGFLALLAVAVIASVGERLIRYSAAGLTVSEGMYLDQARGWSREYSGNFRQLSALAEGYDLRSASWKRDVRSVVGKIRGLNAQVLRAGAPDKFYTSHRYLQQAAQHFDGAMTLLMSGIDRNRSADITLAGQEMRTAQGLIEQATAALP
jgi:hypothetical protein